MARLALSWDVLGKLRLDLLESSLLFVVPGTQVVLWLVRLGRRVFCLDYLGSKTDVLVHSSLGLKSSQDRIDSVCFLPQVVLDGACLGVVLDLVQVVLARCLHG